MIEIPKDPTTPVGQVKNNLDVRQEEPPLLFEPVKAYRHWRITSGRIRTPIHGNFKWKDGENIAWCEATDRPATQCLDPRCACGFYSLWNQSNNYSFKRSAIGPEVCGVVELYGKVVVGPEGARASKAKIGALWLPRADSWDLRRRNNIIRRRYPSIRFYRNWDNMIEQEGVKRPDHLIWPNGRYARY